MHSFFYPKPLPAQGIMKYPGWDTVKDGLRRNLETVIRFYRKSPMVVASDHFLVRILQSITVPQLLNTERYYDNVDALALKLSMALNMTSPIWKGQVFDGIFYGKGCPEILIADDATFDPIKAHAKWESLQPVRVLQHPRSDIDLNLPDGTAWSGEHGIAVIYINIPMLAIQYRAFRLKEMEWQEGTGTSERSIMMFIHMYVLPNMLPSHLDIALFNRFDKFYRGQVVGRSHRALPISTQEYGLKVDHAFESVFDYLVASSRDFHGILQTIPMATNENAWDALLLPKMLSTRQIDWAYVIARLQAMNFLFDISKENPNMTNRKEINQIVQDAQFLKNINVLQTVLPRPYYLAVMAGINSIIEQR